MSMRYRASNWVLCCHVYIINIRIGKMVFGFDHTSELNIFAFSMPFVSLCSISGDSSEGISNFNSIAVSCDLFDRLDAQSFLCSVEDDAMLK